MLRIFLESLKTDESKKRCLCVNDAMIDEYIKEYDDALIPNQTYLSISPNSIILKPNSVMISKNFSCVIDKPTCIRYINNEWWISSYNKEIARFDNNFSFLGYVGKHGSSLPLTDEYSGVMGFYADVTNNILIVACYEGHTVKAFRLDPWSLLWTIGDGTPGNIIDSRMFNPTDIDILPNGNYIITCERGLGQTSGGDVGNGPGHVTEINGSGAIVGSILINSNLLSYTGFPWTNNVNKPFRARVFGSNLYVITHDHYVACYDATTYDYNYSMTSIKGINSYSYDLKGIYIDDTNQEIVIASNGLKKILSFDQTTLDLKWQCGEVKFENSPDFTNSTPGTLLEIYDLYSYNDEYYLACDFGNNRVMLLPKYNEIQVQYDVTIPTGYEIVKELAPKNFDTETFVKTYKVSEYIENEKLCLPIRKCCAGA